MLMSQSQLNSETVYHAATRQKGYDKVLFFFHSTENDSFRTLEGTCPTKDKTTPVYIADTENCNVYYECKDGEAIKNHCEEGFVFNKDQGKCIIAHDSECGKSKPDAKRSRVGVSPRNPIGTCPPVDGPAPVYLPDDVWCDEYYECSNGNPIKFDCQYGLVWDPSKKTCVYDVDSDCGDKLRKMH